MERGVTIFPSLSLAQKVKVFSLASLGASRRYIKSTDEEEQEEEESEQQQQRRQQQSFS